MLIEAYDLYKVLVSDEIASIVPDSCVQVLNITRISFHSTLH